MTDKNRKKLRFTDFDREWEILKLGDVIDIASASRVHKNEWTTEGVRFFRSSDVTAKFFGKVNVPAYISLELYENLSKRSGAVKKGDILITGGGTIGIPYLINDDQPIYFKDADLIWLKSHNIIDGYFLYTYFTSQFLREYIASISHIGTISHYTIEQAKATPIKLPKLEEQKKIGSFFKSLDDTISFHQQELEAFKQTKQGFLQKMFPKEGEVVPKIRFDDFEENWETKKINEIATETFGGGTPKTAEKRFWSGDIPWIQSSDITQHRVYEVFPKKTISEEAVKSSATKLIPKDSIAVVTRVGVGKLALIEYDYSTSQDFVSLSNLKSDKWFTVYSLYRILQRELHNVQGTSIKGITKKELLEKNILLPTNNEEQVKIGEFFRQMDEVIELKEKEIEALKETKKGFLQKMFV